MSPITVRKIEQPVLPSSEPPPPECPVAPDGKHVIHRIESYSTTKYFPPSAYQPFCLYCNYKGTR